MLLGAGPRLGCCPIVHERPPEPKSPPHHRLHPRVAAVNRLDESPPLTPREDAEETEHTTNQAHTNELHTSHTTAARTDQQGHRRRGSKTKKNKKTTEANGEHSSSSSRRSLGLTPIRPARSQQQPNAQRASEEEVCRRPRSKHSGRRSAVPHHASATVAVIVNQATQRQAKATDGGRVVVSRRRLRRRARELGPSSDENEARQGERKLRAKPADFGAASSDHR